MHCKNCQTKLEGEKKFCTNCGAKVINHRLNLKTVMEEFFATFISWDNKFLKTFKHLITKPQLVANSYLDGVRKRYMQPFAPRSRQFVTGGNTTNKYTTERGFFLYATS